MAIASNSSVQITSSPVYAAIQQFGGKAGRGRKVTMPARPFLPVTPSGTLYPDEQREVLEALKAYLAGES